MTPLSQTWTNRPRALYVCLCHQHVSSFHHLSSQVLFLDGISDKLADLSIGRKTQLVLPEEGLDLDGDMFSCGVLNGDAEC